MKLTNIEMDWTDDGARVKYDATPTSVLIIPHIACPRCAAVVKPNSGAHLCGDRLTKHKPATKRSRGAK